MKLLSAVSTLLLHKGAAAQNCPDPSSGDWSETKLNAMLIFKHAVVTANSAEERDILCARLESDKEAWIGFGISPAGTMAGGEAVIGVPGDDSTVQKYTLVGITPRTKVMPTENQTLMDASVTQEDGKTVMEFTKYLKEEGENEILATGENTFLYAIGRDNNLGYHTSKSPFKLDFGTAPTPPSPPAEPSPTTTPPPTPATKSSGAMVGKIAGTMIVGAGVTAVWFGF